MGGVGAGPYIHTQVLVIDLISIIQWWVGRLLYGRSKWIEWCAIRGKFLFFVLLFFSRWFIHRGDFGQNNIRQIEAEIFLRIISYDKWVVTSESNWVEFHDSFHLKNKRKKETRSKIKNKIRKEEGIDNSPVGTGKARAVLTPPSCYSLPIYFFGGGPRPMKRRRSQQKRRRWLYRGICCSMSLLLFYLTQKLRRKSRR